jgi:sialidase-1
VRTDWWLVLTLVLSATLAAGVEPKPLLVIEPGPGNPRNSEGDIIELEDGRLCLIYSRFTGGSGDDAAADLAMRISQDEGRTWSEDKIVVSRGDCLNVMSVSLRRLAGGEIALFYLRKASETDCRPRMSISTDEAQTWSPPTLCISDEVGYYVLNNDRAVQLHSGRLVLPVAWHRGPGQPWDSAGVIMCYLSDDRGKTWRRSKSSFKGYAPDGRRITVQEPGVIELKDGRLVMYMRTDAGSQYVCHSRDGGETWSKPEPSPLASPLSPASIERIPWTGDLLCVWNDHSGVHRFPAGRRTPLCMAISKDEGKTWGKSKIIEDDPDGWYCYTAITFVKDRVLVAYCAGDKKIGGLNRLKVTAISRDSLTSVRASDTLRAWEFDSEKDLQVWRPNAHLADVTAVNGTVRARAVDSDPFLLCRDIAIDATPYQYVIIRMKASRAGVAELFWSGQLEGQYGGLTEAKKLRFSVQGESRWHEVVLFPFWHTERTIRQLRLDLYEGTDFEIDSIRIGRWGRGEIDSGDGSWTFDGDVSKWQVHPAASDLFAPPITLDVNDKKWVSVELACDKEAVASILWAGDDMPGLQSEEFPIRGDGKVHMYNLRMDNPRTWRHKLCAFGIRLPQDAKTQLNHIQIAGEPLGPGEIEVSYFGFEDGVNRAGRPCKVLAQVTSSGGPTHGIRQVHLYPPNGLKIISEPQTPGHPGIQHGEVARFVWEVMAEKPGLYPVRLSFSGKGEFPQDQSASLEFTQAPAVARATYVPEPRPARTDIDICAFYFPGWESNAKWDCVRKTAPNRKPVLGYYDESNPECVDWQIKWAVENGISCFLVDWYWVQGRQQLTHWFEAYRKAKYQDMLKVAIMWANHNPPGTHSADDWLKVAAHWITAYFSLPGYYRIDGKPAIFLWDPKGLRNDLGGSEAVHQAFEKSQEMAHNAGFGGITLIALGYDFSQGHIRALREEGYSGVTTYHEWGSRIDGQVSQKLFRFEDVVRESPASWKQKNEAADGLMYYPLVDTGWDSRPWHGSKAMVIQDRTPELCKELLKQAKSFCRQNNKTMVILGPVNEWGEGSYIEPCTEFGFKMLEAVQSTFAAEPPGNWPVNIAPSDVGLGPYDFPAQQGADQP